MKRNRSRKQKPINGGLYLVIDPKPGLDSIYLNVKQAIRGGVDILQIWNHWADDQDQEHFILKICDLAHKNNIPVFINERWEWVNKTPLNGVHFDHIPDDWSEIVTKIDMKSGFGLTCGNDYKRIDWAIQNGMDYISFCAMFPSPSVNDCPIVQPETVRKTRSLTNMPIFASGGINTKNMGSLIKLGINGVAVISGIMNSDDPEKAARSYKQILSHQPQK